MTDDAPQQEVATIKSAMASPRSEYWSGPKIDGETVMQRRYRELVDTPAPAEQQGDGEGGEKEFRSEFFSPGDVAEQWAEVIGASPADVQQGMERVNGIAEEIGDVTDLEFVFEGLPDAVQHHALAGLLRPAHAAVPASEQQVAMFRATNAGRELKHLSAVSIGRIRHRWENATAAMSDQEATVLHDFWHRQPLNERVAILRALAK
jgi:hypothetical protein